MLWRDTCHESVCQTLVLGVVQLFLVVKGYLIDVVLALYHGPSQLWSYKGVFGNSTTSQRPLQIMKVVTVGPGRCRKAAVRTRWQR